MIEGDGQGVLKCKNYPKYLGAQWDTKNSAESFNLFSGPVNSCLDKYKIVLFLQTLVNYCL